MPEICRLLGIVISMYFDEHNPPHFPADVECHRVSSFTEKVLLSHAFWQPDSKVLAAHGEFSAVHVA